MKKKLVLVLLMSGAIVLSACGATDNGTSSVEMAAGEIEETVFTSDLSESEILEIYESTIAQEEYERAGREIYVWLQSHNSKAVSEKLDWIKDHMYVSSYTCTAYDDEDNVLDMSRYEFDERGDTTKEEYYIDDEVNVSYSYAYTYDGDTCTSQTCYDNNGDILYTWEGILDEDGRLSYETDRYNNLATEQSTEHVYDEDGHCVIERMTYAGEDGVSTKQHIEFEYDGDKIIKELYYDEDNNLFEIVNNEYNEDGNILLNEYCLPNGEPYLSYAYEYDNKGNVIRDVTMEAAHDETSSDHEETYEYTYDKFGNKATEKFFMHEDLTTDSKYDYDFLGNVVLENSTSGDFRTVKIYDYTYSFKE